MPHHTQNRIGGEPVAAEVTATRTHLLASGRGELRRAGLAGGAPAGGAPAGGAPAGGAPAGATGAWPGGGVGARRPKAVRDGGGR